MDFVTVHTLQMVSQKYHRVVLNPWLFLNLCIPWNRYLAHAYAEDGFFVILILLIEQLALFNLICSSL